MRLIDWCEPLKGLTTIINLLQLTNPYLEKLRDHGGVIVVHADMKRENDCNKGVQGRAVKHEVVDARDPSGSHYKVYAQVLELIEVVSLGVSPADSLVYLPQVHLNVSDLSWP